MRVRGTQAHVKPIEVNIDTVYIRSNIQRIEEDEFIGWEYDEERYGLRDYIEHLTREDDAQTMALLIAVLMSEVDYLRVRIENLEGRILNE